MPESASEQLCQAFDRQIEWCVRLASPFMAQLLAVSRDRIAGDGALSQRLLDLVPAPGPGLIALRWAGALHDLALSGREPFASLWPSMRADLAGDLPPVSDAQIADAVEQAIADEWPHMLSFLASAPQTNEVRRGAALLPGWLHIAARTGLPLALIEIGASAGLNLWADRWHHEHGAWRWSGAATEVLISSEWRGALPPQPSLSIASRQGCDLAPLDIADARQRRRLAAYVWTDQPERLALLRAALASAAVWHAEAGLGIAAADAGDYLERELRLPREGCTTVVYHSIVWQYLTAPQRERAQAAIEAAGARATPSAPLAWLSYEFRTADEPAQLRCRIWPGLGAGAGAGAHADAGSASSDEILATVHPHCAWVHWSEPAA